MAAEEAERVAQERRKEAEEAAAAATTRSSASWRSTTARCCTSTFEPAARRAFFPRSRRLSRLSTAFAAAHRAFAPRLRQEAPEDRQGQSVSDCPDCPDWATEAGHAARRPRRGSGARLAPLDDPSFASDAGTVVKSFGTTARLTDPRAATAESEDAPLPGDSVGAVRGDRRAQPRGS